MVSRYRVSRRLGSGGFARVYCALDPDLELDVALKILRPELAADPDTVERFRREASMAAKLRHPNVITVLTVGRLEEAFDGAAPGTPYLVMDLLPDSLADRIAGGAALPPDEVARVGAEVARGLGFAHRHGIVHRDVKPENVLFARDGRAVVTDFGIARAVAGSPTASSRQVVLGTPTYFSPEQARGLPLDGRSDIYALGVTLFRAATGVLPFPGDDWYDVMRQHVEAQPPRIRALAPTVPPTLDAVITRCLAKRPDDRFATAEVLAAALDSARGGRPSGAATVVVPGPVRLRRRRRAALWVTAGGVATVAAAVLTAGALRGRFLGTPAVQDTSVAVPVAPVSRSTDGRLAAAPPGITTPPPDSARGLATTTAVARPAAPPRPPAPALAVDVPAEAEVYVDGARVARGPWERDGVRPGRHTVRATVTSLPGCASADTSVAVDLVPGVRQFVRLDPVACGELSFDVMPTAAHYRLEPARGGPPREGVLPLAGPLFLPDGNYALTIDAAQCTPYTATVPVVAGRTRTERAHLICN